MAVVGGISDSNVLLIPLADQNPRGLVLSASIFLTEEAHLTDFPVHRVLSPLDGGWFVDT
jgi:hypothetical protein